MRKRRAACLVGTGATLVGLAVLSWWAQGPAHRITYDSAAQFRPGMEFAELQALLGAPPGEYTTAPHARAVRDQWQGQPFPREGYERLTWLSDEVYVMCHVRRADGDVQDLAYAYVGPTPIPWWQSLKRRLGL
jgi:hypothetical protein